MVTKPSRVEARVNRTKSSAIAMPNMHNVCPTTKIRHNRRLEIEIAQRQQQQDAQRQRQLVERRDKPDLCLADPEPARDLADDRVDVIGIGGNHRDGRREGIFLSAAQIGCGR